MLTLWLAVLAMVLAAGRGVVLSAGWLAGCGIGLVLALVLDQHNTLCVADGGYNTHVSLRLGLA